MTLNVISVCSQYGVEELLASAPRAKAQSDFLKLNWSQGAVLRDSEGFLDVLQRSVNENAITVVIDGSQGFYTKAMIAEGLDLHLQEDAKSRQAVETYCEDRGLSLSIRALEGCNLPEGALPLNSNQSMDQGFLLVKGGRCIVVFPENTAAFDDMFANGFYPFLLRNGSDTAVVQTIAIRESKLSDVQEYLRLFKHGKNILPLVYQEDGQWNLSITAIRGSVEESRQACESMVENITAEMGDFILTAGNARKEKKLQKANKNNASSEEEAPKKRKVSALQANDQPRQAEKKPKKSGFGIVRKVLLFICICTFLGSAGYLGLRYYNSVANVQNYENLREVYESGGFPSLGYPSDYDNAFSGLYQINEDVAGWLSIEGTSLDYPIVQTTDNNYYHRLSFEGDYSLYGVPFVDYNVDLKEPSTNTIIYGHNIKNDDQMFNSLVHYWNVDYYTEHPVIDFHTIYGKRSYKIFAVFVANVNPDHGEVFQYHTFIDANDVSEIQEYIYNVQVRSILDTGVDVLPSDELLTLSTCTYEFDNARFVVVARRLRDGESREVDASLVSKASNPLMPDIWYQLYGGTKPVLQVPTFADTIVLDANTTDPVPLTTQTSTTESTEPEYETETLASQALRAVMAALTSNLSVEEEESVPASTTTTDTVVLQTPTTTVTETTPAETTPTEETPSTETTEETTTEGETTTETPEEEVTEEETTEETEESKEETAESTTVSEEEEEEESTVVSTYNSDETLSVKINGSTVTKSAYDIVCMMVQAEMGTTFHSEALKAQAVAAYTYVKYNNNAGIKPSIAAKTSISSNVASAVQEVIGQAVYYNGAYANTTYCAANAGVSNSSVDVWGGSIPYLVSVSSPGDKSTTHYGYETRLTLDYVAQRIKDYHNVDPYSYSSDPADWFGDYEYSNGKYISTIEVCGRNIKGRYVREGLLQSKIRSAAFEVEYDDSTEQFIFTTYGYGHGVGMSQLGANYYAKQGWSYVEILEHYYTGTKVK